MQRRGGGGGGGGGGDTYRAISPSRARLNHHPHERYFVASRRSSCRPCSREPHRPSAPATDAFQDGYERGRFGAETWWQRTSGEGPPHRFGGSIFDDDGGDVSPRGVKAAYASPTPAPTEDDDDDDDDDDDESGVYVTSCVATVP